MTIKDCGRPYDPVANGMDAASFGARSAAYRYMFTMNVTTIVWDRGVGSTDQLTISYNQ